VHREKHRREGSGAIRGGTEGLLSIRTQRSAQTGFIFEVVVVSMSFSLKQKYYSFSLFYIKIHNLSNIISAISLLFKEKEKTGEFLPDFPTKLYGFSVLKTNSINIHSKVSNLVLIENLTICLTKLQHFVESQFKLLGT